MLYCLGSIFAIFFLLATAASSYFVIENHSYILANASEGVTDGVTDDGRHCNFSLVVLIDVVFAYAAMLIYSILWITCILVQSGMQNQVIYRRRR